jgi:hypothetical protein
MAAIFIHNNKKRRMLQKGMASFLIGGRITVDLSLEYEGKSIKTS